MDQRIIEIMEICEGLPPTEHGAAFIFLDGVIGQLRNLSLNALSPLQIAYRYQLEGNEAELDVTRGRIEGFNISYLDLISLQPVISN